MHVVTLISARNDPRVSRSLVEQAQYIIGEAEIFWLERDTACDLVTEDAPDATTRQALSRLALSAAVDCTVQPVLGRRKSILLADMDSTMIDQECIDELAAEIGIKDKVAAITARAMNGEIAFEPALRERVALLRDLPVARVRDVLAGRIQLATGGKALVATMRAHGAYTALVSGGFTLFTQNVAEQLGFDENRANTLDVVDGALTGTVAEPILGADAKLAALHEIAASRGVDADAVLAVGDGANDLPMILAAGTGVALHAKPAVAAKAPFRLDHADLTGLLFMQGYKAAQFVDG